MEIDEALICGYYEDDDKIDYTIEIDTPQLKKWFIQEELDLLDFETQMDKKIAVYNILEEEFTKNLSHYKNFTVKFK